MLNTLNVVKELSNSNEKSVIWADQFDNVANAMAHYQTTGEIWEQTEKRIDGFICAVGSGGTLSGISKFFKGMQENYSNRIS